MNTYHSLKTLLVAGALALGLTGTAVASQDPATSADALEAPVGQGLLGQSFYHASYGFLNLDGTGVDAHSLTLDYNRPVDDTLDTFASVRFLRSGTLPGGRYSEQGLNFGARFYTLFHGVKPYWDAGIGWVWAKGPGGFKDNTFAYNTSVGVEIPTSFNLSLTPYLQYADAIDFDDGDSWNVGVKGNYWVNDRTSVLVAVERAIEESWEYRFGMNVRF